MEDFLKIKMNYSLNGEEVQKIAGDFHIKVLKYKELSQYRTLNELLSPSDAAIILYEYKHNMGHWCCVFKHKDKSAEFWDPLGYKPDHEFEFIPDSYTTKKYLSKLLYDYKYPVLYNE